MKAFIAAHYCVNCKKELSDSQIMYSDGVCPLCGHVTPGTICDTTKTAKEIVLEKKSFWKVWKL